jgi:23S rRNA pseudouridine1911/1915/1917 synthase
MPEIVTSQSIQDHDRLDRCLVAMNLATSRSEASRWIADGRVKINGEIETKASRAVKVSDKILIDKPALKISEIVPKEIDFEILHEDDDIIVVNKPAGLTVHPGAGNYDESLVHGLLYRCKNLSGIGGVERPGIVHRLDKGTSGVMVIAKNDKAHQGLSLQFQNRDVKKEYLALALGKIEKTEQTLVNLMKRSETNRKKFVVNQKKGKEAITHIRVIKKNERVSYVSVKIDTGRTHQIRVHLSFIHHPILGDETYGGTKKLHLFNESEKAFVRELNRPLLHAHRLSFTHPTRKKKMDFVVPIPMDFQKALGIFWDGEPVPYENEGE